MQVSLYSDPDYRLWVTLGRTGDVLARARGVELRKHGISGVEAFALFVIKDVGDMCTPADIARRLSRGHNTVSALLIRMEKKGLVIRARDSENRNVWRLSLTQAGEVACREAKKLESIHTAMSVLPDAEKQTLEDSLKAIYEKALIQLVAEGNFH